MSKWKETETNGEEESYNKSQVVIKTEMPFSARLKSKCQNVVL
jgi:hypothetical protein